MVFLRVSLWGMNNDAGVIKRCEHIKHFHACSVGVVNKFELELELDFDLNLCLVRLSVTEISKF